MTAEGRSRPTWVEVDAAAISRNVAKLRAVTETAVCAVVKADGYSHGAVAAAEAALQGGAAGLAVALVDEGVELRRAGIGAPILVLSEPPLEYFSVCFDERLTPTIATKEGLAAAAQAGLEHGGRNRVHMKVDTGMHRVGVPVEEAQALAKEICSVGVLHLEGVFTHFAVADGEGDHDLDFTRLQMERFNHVVSQLHDISITPEIRHAANSAGALCHPSSRYEMVRCGLAIYGLAPSGRGAEALTQHGLSPLEPAMSIKAKVSAVHDIAQGERPSYGRYRPLPHDAIVATVPMGYADGLPRRLFTSGYEVLINGRRRPLAGMVSMDQIMVDCEDDHSVKVGDEVVLLGRQGTECITAAEWADRLGTITWEVLCGIGPRVPRLVVNSTSQG